MKRPDAANVVAIVGAVIVAIALVWLADKVGSAMAGAALRFDQQYQEYRQHER